MSKKDEGSIPLDRIEGIGNERRRILEENFGIYSMADLAQCSDEISHEIASKLHGVSQPMVSAWITEARQILANVEQSLESVDAESAESVANGLTDESGRGATASSESAQPHRPEPGLPGSALLNVEGQELAAAWSDWQDIASMVVYFQLRQHEGGAETRRISVHRIQNGGQNAEFDGFDYETLCSWMADQVREIRVAERDNLHAARNEPATRYPSTSARPELRFVWIRAFQPPISHQPASMAMAGGAFAQRIEADSPLSFEICFRLRAATATELAAIGAGYRSRFYLQEVATRRKTHLGDSELTPLIAEQTTYTSRVSHVKLVPGLYRVQVVVELQSLSPSSHFLEAPFLTVA